MPGHVTVGGASIAYEVAGRGPALLLIAGLGAGRWVWEPQVTALSPAFQVVTFDNRGIGGSSRGTGRLSIPRMAGDAVAVLDALGIERAHIAGMSMGGFIAQQVAIDYPGRVEKLVLCCTAGRGAGQVWPAPQFLGLALGGFLAGGVAGGRLRVFFSARYLAENPAEVKRWVKLAMQSLPDHRVLMSQLWAAAAFRPDGRALKGITHPALVIHGTEDRIIPVSNGKRLARSIPGARIVLFEGAGHGVTIERADEVNREMEGFLGTPDHQGRKAIS